MSIDEIIANSVSGLDEDEKVEKFKEIRTILQQVKTDICEMLDHECEVFDPICDGPIEHAEGMAMAKDLVERYLTITEGITACDCLSVKLEAQKQLCQTHANLSTVNVTAILDELNILEEVVDIWKNILTSAEE